MNQLLFILTIIVALIIIYFYVLKKGESPGKKTALWRECRRKLRLPDKIADETIERHIKRLKERHPNRSEEWYLEKILYDLDRDRR